MTAVAAVAPMTAAAVAAIAAIAAVAAMTAVAVALAVPSSQEAPPFTFSSIASSRSTQGRSKSLFMYISRWVVAPALLSKGCAATRCSARLSFPAGLSTGAPRKAQAAGTR
jgi:hypothetical protein